MAALVAVSVFSITVQAKGQNSGRNGEVEFELEHGVKAMKLQGLKGEDFEKLHRKPLLVITPEGHIVVNEATVTAISGNPKVMTVQVWSQTLVVNLTDSKVLPGDQDIDAIKVGHKVSFKGDINAQGAIKSQIVRDWNLEDQESAAKIHERIAELLKKINDLRVKINLSPVNI